MLSIFLCKVSIMIPLRNAPQTFFQKKNQHQRSSKENLLHLPGRITRLSCVRVLRDSSLTNFWTFSSLEKLGKIIDSSRSGLVSDGFTNNFFPAFFDSGLYHQDLKSMKRLKHGRIYYIFRLLNWLYFYELLRDRETIFQGLNPQNIVVHFHPKFFGVFTTILMELNFRVFTTKNQ